VRALPSEEPWTWHLVAALVVTLFVPPAGLVLGVVGLSRTLRDSASSGTARWRWGTITAFAVAWTLVWLALVTHR